VPCSSVAVAKPPAGRVPTALSLPVILSVALLLYRRPRTISSLLSSVLIVRMCLVSLFDGNAFALPLFFLWPGSRARFVIRRQRDPAYDSRSFQFFGTDVFYYRVLFFPLRFCGCYLYGSSFSPGRSIICLRCLLFNMQCFFFFWHFFFRHFFFFLFLSCFFRSCLNIYF